MGVGENGEGPAVLQLHRWDPSHIRPDLSEYQEAFLSPMRELLLLHSYQSEALLLPLSRDDSYCISSEYCKYESQESVNLSSSSACRPDSLGDIRSNPESVEGVSNDVYSAKSSISQSNTFPSISDVSSLAWGLCGDTYKQNKEAPFREFLIVVGNCGVIFHAFRQINETNATQSFEDENKPGRWVEWGPGSVSPCDNEALGDVSVASRTSGAEGNVSYTGQDSTSHVVSSSTSKKWLQSFLSSSKVMESDGTIRTCFPEKLVLPCSATVVSFFVDFRDSVLVNFYSSTRSVLDESVHGEKRVQIPLDHTSLDSIKSVANVSASSSYTCFRVFSSWFHYMIGFVLSAGFDNTKISCDYSCESQDIVVVVGLLDIYGIQWLYNVKLPQKGIGLEPEWVDFQISDKFLISLNKFGSILLHGAVTGEYIAYLDILHIHGVKPEKNLSEQETSSIAMNIADGDVLRNKFEDTQACSVAYKRSFRRLIVAPYSCQFSVVDECGVLYIICASDHVPDKYVMIDKILPQYLKLGVLAPWVVGHSNISQQNVFCTSSGCEKSVIKDDLGSGQHVQNWHIQGMVSQNDLNLNGFATISQQSSPTVSESRCKCCIRKLFIPIARHGGADIICFSSFGVTRLIRRNSIDERSCIVHTSLYIDSKFCDDNCVNVVNRTLDLQSEANVVDEEAVGCIFQGSLYLVTRKGVSIVLPAVSLSSNFHTIDSISYHSTKTTQSTALNLQKSSIYDKSKQLRSPWQVAVLDRIILYEGPHEADRLCLENGWNLGFSRLRRLQLALAYFRFEEMDLALGMLAEVDIAEEGILLLIFGAIYMIVDRIGNDAEVSAALRILALGARFAIQMLRKFAILELTNECSQPLLMSSKDHRKFTDSRRLHEMAYYLEIIRNIQCQLAAKFTRLGKGSLQVDTLEAHPEGPQNSPEDHYQLSSATDDVILEKPNKHEPALHERDASFNESEKLSLVPVEPLGSNRLVNSEMPDEESILVSGAIPRTKLFPMENPKEMFARWEMDNLDLRNVVKDALLAGRLPLAVLQLHLHQRKKFVDDKKPSDTFSEVRDIGKAIAYELLLKGETTLAVSTLQKLGEDIEACLKQLIFGTVSRSLRKQIAEEAKKDGFLGLDELAILDRISLIERIYPCNNFWKTYAFRRKEGSEDLLPTKASGNYRLHLLFPPVFRNLVIECGDIDGVVLGSWANFNGVGSTEIDDDSSHAGYWAAAAVWSYVWDQTTIDRILLDQPFLLGVHVMWESQLEYHVCHNDWEEVSKLLYMIPSSLLAEQSLLISLDSLQSSSSSRYSMEFPDYGSYACSPDELDAVCIDIPNVRIFNSSATGMCSSWLRILISKELAKRFIFLKEYWDGAGEVIFLLAQCGFLDGENGMAAQNGSLDHSAILDPANVGVLHPNTLQAFHKLLVHYAAQNNLPYFLDLYLDHHKLALDDEAISALLEATGDHQWAKWLLFSRIKGHEYDASFFNARALLVRDVSSDSSLPVLEANEIISTVDDIAEAGWLMAALATLMFAPLPIQSCLSSGSVKRSSNSFQCTLENLRPALQKFPTLWRTLVASCLGHDTTQSFWGLKGRNALSAYIKWRDSVFYSSGHDTSLLLMLPCWFPTSLRRLIQLFVQGPLGWQSMTSLTAEEAYLQRDIEFLMNVQEYSEISAMSWEAAIQKQIEQELYPSSIEETGLALEQHLHRGRALAAFNQLLGSRVHQLKSGVVDRGQSNTSLRGQANVQSDVQTLLSPLTQDEESFLSSVVPLAITHFQDHVLVSSCALLLEICGLSASVLRVDVAALRRIHSFYRSNQIMQQNQLLSNNATLHAASSEATVADSVAQALADYYLHQSGNINKQEDAQKPATNHLPPTLLLVLQHLEKASLLSYAGEKTCGSWLLSGEGDGNELRSQQKAASQHWNLVTLFCQMHRIPLSTVYLAFLARDNDWVGFLSEAQVGGYPFDLVIQVAAKEFTDPRLRTHILTVLRGMQWRRKNASPSNSDSPKGRNESSHPDQTLFISAELFQILAQCEKQKESGKSLLLKAKELSWSLLAVVASCFPDVAPLSCLTVWLEITAAREICSSRENEIATQIANNVGAAVETLNSLPAGDRVSTVHYNRKSPRRRRLMNDISEDFSSATASCTSNDHAKILVEELKELGTKDDVKLVKSSDDWSTSLPKLVAVLCQRNQFFPLLRAFEMFLPSCPLLPFIRALQAFSQMRLSEASVHLGVFSSSKEEASWISSTAVKAADAILSTCPSPYEKRCLLQLLASSDFADGGSAAAYYQRLYWKINLAEPALRKHEDLQLGNETLDDASLLTALENNGYWEQARSWARQLEASGTPWKSAAHHVTERQAESMVAEWKEFLWDVPEERVALWRHCQNLFIRYSFPALKAGLFFLKHAEMVEKELPSRELHALLLLSLQWLSGIITQSNPVCPLHLLREIETRIWLLAVESEAHIKGEQVSNFTRSSQDQMSGNSANIVDQTADVVMKMDSHINSVKNRASEKGDIKENNNLRHKSSLTWDAGISAATGSTKIKRRTKPYGSSRQSMTEIDRSADVDSDADGSSLPPLNHIYDLQDENLRIDASFSSWEERIGPAELERAVLSLLEFGQITAAKQLQHKLSSGHVPFQLKIVDAALKFAELSTPLQKHSLLMLDEDLRSLIQSYNLPTEDHLFDPLQVLESLSDILTEGSGRGLCKRISAVLKAANVLGVSFAEAFEKQPTDLLQLLSLKAQDSFDEARLLVQSHPIPATSIAKILAESFLKGLLAAHRGGYIDSQKEEGPAPLLWRFSDFLKWADLCPSEQEIGHALMRLVITGQEIPHACEVELLILSHHFYQSSACLDGVDVLVALAATRVEAYVSEGDFSCLARLITGVGNFHGLNFILGILIENKQLDLLLQKYSAAADANSAVAESVRGFRMAVVTALKHFNPNDHDDLAMVYKHFDLKHETASLLESRAEQSYQRWILRPDKDHNEDLLESMHFYIEAAEVHSSIDAGNKTRSACAQASLVSLQIRMPDIQWLNLSETSARRLLVEQTRFQEALIVAEAYKINQPSEWTPVLWTQMLKPEVVEQFVAEFVAVLPLQNSVLIELAKFYRAEMVARVDQSHFSVWLTGGGLPAEWAKYLGRSFRCLLKRTRDLRFRLQMASIATGFIDVVDACNKTLDKVPENAGPLVLRKGHGGAYLPLM
ncbi:uncharacterized protein LOC110695197 isoform X1 [Chenopodium quinoa]|uniref:uncharacterized protein LOC110695197 isoform X1 n=1 Tax=Chenopodium quinoa TaxID=63459 RepID=UPI000B76E703|nr:uncharacterized protein LOC110695197 isoform X1 [Chenopodium quinoa]XP_021728109.1 uncharacterized protein LOC110695197 isoform X1 [Chenopodium quinoa]